MAKNRLIDLSITGNEMTEKEFERYKFLRLYSIDLNTAQHYLKLIECYKDNQVRFPILLSAIISYSKPFSLNRGSLIKRHSLSEKYIPNELQDMHKYLIDHRNRQFAHTDLEFNYGGIADFGTAKQKWFPMSFRRPPLIEMDQKISVIRDLVNRVEKSLNDEIERIEVLIHKEIQEEKAKSSKKRK